MSMSVVRQKAAYIKRMQIEKIINNCKIRKRMSRVDKAIALSNLVKEVKLIPVLSKADDCKNFDQIEHIKILI